MKVNFARVGWAPDAYAATSLDKALKEHRTHIGEDWRTLVAYPEVEIIV